MIVKIRKPGDSKFLPVPKNINIDKSTTYDVFKEHDGTLIFSPHHNNPFKDRKYIKEHHFKGNNKSFINMDTGNEN